MRFDHYTFDFLKICSILFLFSISFSINAQNTQETEDMKLHRSKAMTALEFESSQDEKLEKKESPKYYSGYEEKINNLLKEVRTLLMNKEKSKRFGDEFAALIYSKAEQACPSIPLKELIYSKSDYVASKVSSEDELSYAVELLNHSIQFLGGN